MPPDSPPAAVPAPDIASNPPTLIELFLAFAKMALAGFGGVLYWARRGIVDQHRWMTADEFNETYALCHFLPGPNIVNLSFVFGSRFRGIAGGIAAFSGLVGDRSVDRHGLADDDAAGQKARRRRICVVGCGVYRHRGAAAAAGGGVAGGDPAQHRHHL